MTAPKYCPVPLWIDDLCFERILDILEGKKKVSDEVLKNIIEVGRSKIDYTRRRHKSSLTRLTNKTNFAKQKPTKK